MQFLATNLEQRKYSLVSIDLIPRFFRNAHQFSELITDVYPILKLLLKFNSNKTRSDHSFRKVIHNKMSNASKSFEKQKQGIC